MAYTLYFYPYSIVSIMARYAIALRGPPKEGLSDLSINEQAVDIVVNLEQLSEDYLCNVNPKGQVPVLAGGDLPAPIPDSEEILYFLAKLYPRMIPTEHEAQIRQLVKKLHQINYFSLSFTGNISVPRGVLAKISGLIEDESISEQYRKALRYKFQVNEREKVGGLDEGVPARESKKAEVLMADLAKLLPGEDATGPWMFGLEHPSGLDAHLIVFITRLQDVGRGAIVPEALRAYAERARAAPAWESVMQGRQTVKK
ncbi:hypothetical protein GQ53DRAFT_331629 [Thozetella sp. PMI_491]|nr:hypothetical protein GQ53DRAFT_331629 [Thozetella sp. PMI_491]